MNASSGMLFYDRNNRGEPWSLLGYQRDDMPADHLSKWASAFGHHEKAKRRTDYQLGWRRGPHEGVALTLPTSLPADTQLIMLFG
jgi:hypothetical protein